MAKDNEQVAPIESADKAPDNESKTPVKDRLEAEGIDTSHPEFYNLDLEAERAKERAININITKG